MSSTFSFSYPEEASTSVATILFQSSSSLPPLPFSPQRPAPQPLKQDCKKLGRHIAMKEPSQCGLFTVCEIPETERELQKQEAMEAESLANEGSIYSCTSAIRSSEAFCLTPGRDELELEVYNESMTTDADLTILQIPSAESTRRLHRLSWSSSDSDERPVVTPLMGMENEDPFLCWSHVPFDDGENDDDFEMSEADVSRTISQPLFSTPPSMSGSKLFSRRAPPALALKSRFSLAQSSMTSPAVSPTLIAHPVSAARPTADSDILAPRSTTSATSNYLMPPLPIMSSNDWATELREAEDIVINVVTPTTPTLVRGRKSLKTSSQSPISKNIDLASALEDLLSSCGEATAADSLFCASDGGDFETKALDFPRPSNGSDLSPGGSLHTPEKKSKRSAAPYAPRKPSRAHPHSQIPPKMKGGRVSPKSLEGDHSFLTYLSRNESQVSRKWSVKSDSGASSLGGCSTGNDGCRKLPERMGLPMEWFGQRI